MAEKTPVRVNFDNSNNAVGFAEYQSSDYIGLDDGGKYYNSKQYNHNIR